MTKAFDSTIRAQYSSYCDSTLSGAINTAACQLTSKSWFHMDPIDPSAATPEYYYNRAKKHLPVGLFVIDYIRDVSSPVIPQLIIKVILIKYEIINSYFFRNVAFIIFISIRMPSLLSISKK